MSSSSNNTLAIASQLMPWSSSTSAFARRAKRCAADPSRASSIRSCRDTLSRNPGRIIGPVESNSDPLGKRTGPDSQRVGVYYTNGGVEEGAARTTQFLSSAQFGRLGKLVVTANYVSPMLVDGIRIASRAGAKLVGKIRS